MTDDSHKESTLKEHEKFWAFVILILIVSGLVLLSVFGLGSNSESPSTDIVYAARLRIVDIAVTGLLTIAGMAAQALFRVSSTDRISAETALEAARKLPRLPDPEPQQVEVVNTPDSPAIVQEAASEAELPEYAR